MAEQDLDRSEAATDFKLRKARDQGQVARSAEINGAVLFAVAMAYAAACGFGVLLAVADAWRQAWASLHAADLAAVRQIASAFAMRVAGELVAPTLIVLLAALVAGFAQAGPVFSLHAVSPDIQRLHPGRVLRRLFSMRTVLETVRSLAKVGAITAVAWFAIEQLLAELPVLASSRPMQQARMLVEQLTSLGLRLAAVLAAFALWDLVRARREFAKDMRMSRREVRDEHKQREGDPRIRARLRELRRKLLKRSSAVGRTKDADVVVTNPTHLAIALRYEEARMGAPTVIAKGAGAMAAAMRGIAARHRVTVLRSPELARRLFRQVEVDQELPTAFHGEVAAIYAWLYAMRRRTAGAGGQPA
jgi:flagellar biosynthetic protein FlhB